MNHNGDFKARLGEAGHPGLLSQTDRLKRLKLGQNPYVTGPALPGNSPVFFGRTQILHEILSTLRHSDKPGCVSLLGERRIGKSSLLNQVYAALGQEAGLVCIYATTQNWETATRQRFFSQLHAAIAEATGADAAGTVEDYPGFREFIGTLVGGRGLRFVLLLDEFDVMAGNPEFDEQFFYQLRALGDLPEYRFGYLTASRRPLKALCDSHGIAASKFWNIFDRRRLGLLSDSEAEALAAEPFKQTLPPERCPDLPLFWREKVRPWTGPHPLMIQIVASAHWNALDGDYQPNLRETRAKLREHLESFWSSCEEAERRYLAQGQRPGGDPRIKEELQERGLLGEDGKPFSDYFNKLTLEFAKANNGLDKRLAGVHQKLSLIDKIANLWEKLWKSLEKIGQPVGKCLRVYSGKSSQDEEPEE